MLRIIHAFNMDRESISFYKSHGTSPFNYFMLKAASSCRIVFSFGTINCFQTIFFKFKIYF